MIRSAACVAGLLSGVLAAHAENETIPNTTAAVTWPKIFIQGANGLIEPPDPDTQRRYFNLAHCECAKANRMIGTRPVTFGYQVKTTAMTTLNRPADVWVGTSCEMDTVRDMMCRRTAVTLQVDNLFQSTGPNVELSVYDVINGKDTLGPCRDAEGDATIYLGIDTDGNASYDFWSTKKVNSEMSVVPGGVDTMPPPLPVDLTAVAGEESIEILWTPPDGREDDLYQFQAMCEVDGEAITTDPPQPEFQTTQTLCAFTTTTGCSGGAPNGTCETTESIKTCPDDCSMTASPLPDNGDDLAVTTAPEAFRKLDPRFLCGETVEGTARILRIDGLENDVRYKVALLAIDQWGNVQGTYFNRTVTPRSVIDFWEDLHDRGSQVKGGCAWHEPGMFIFLGMVLAACVLGRRPRGRALRALPAAALVLVLAPGTLRADDFTPYWEEPTGADAGEDTEETVRWHIGVRLGPYIPDIDKQHSVNPVTNKGPYEEMFGDYYIEGKKKSRYLWHVLPMLDVDFILWRGFGQLGIGASAGYMQKSAKAYANGTKPEDVMRERSPASEHTFRLVPLALTAVYRFTYLDEAYGVPVVPYVRGGLSYYGWWMKTPDGDLSRVCEDPTAPPTACPSYDKARGGTLGFQGSVGIALRAERIDADAAMSMRNSGLYHAGFYAEYQYAKVDGFGDDTKLWVGDATWFAGVDFEF
jgi:hypothetical protein